MKRLHVPLGSSVPIEVEDGIGQESENADTGESEPTSPVGSSADPTSPPLSGQPAGWGEGTESEPEVSDDIGPFEANESG